MSRWIPLFLICGSLGCDSTKRQASEDEPQDKATAAPAPVSGKAKTKPQVVPAPPEKAALSWTSVLERWARVPEEPDEPEFSVCGSELCMKWDGQSYLLNQKATEIEKVSPTPQRYELSYGLSYSCEKITGRKFEVSRDLVRARWANTVAYRKYQSGDYEAAAQGFATASRLAPDFEKARINLASALLHLKQLDAATAALLQEDGTMSLKVLWQALLDEELKPLLDRAPFQKSLGATPSPTKISPLTYGAEGLSPLGVLVSDQRGWAAVVSTHESWGSEQAQESLDIFDLKTGQRVHRQELISWLDTDTLNRLLPERAKAVKLRLKSAASFLTRLGFSQLNETEAVTGKDGGDLHSAQFVNQNFGVTVDASTVRIFRSGKLIKRHPSPRELGYMTRAHYLPRQDVVIVETHLDEPEGCLKEADIAASTLVPLGGFLSTL